MAYTPVVVHYDRETIVDPTPAIGQTAPPSFTQKFHDELDDRVKMGLADLDKAQAKMDRILSGEDKPTKANLKAIKEDYRMAAQEIRSNMPYVTDQVHEGIENRMGTAVIEFEAYVARSLEARGLGNLLSEAPRLLESKPLELGAEAVDTVSRREAEAEFESRAGLP